MLDPLENIHIFTKAQNRHITLLEFHNLQHFSEISGKENKCGDETPPPF
jgi:hypothetical protein